MINGPKNGTDTKKKTEVQNEDGKKSVIPCATEQQQSVDRYQIMWIDAVKGTLLSQADE